MCAGMRLEASSAVSSGVVLCLGQEWRGEKLGAVLAGPMARAPKDSMARALADYYFALRIKMLAREQAREVAPDF